MGDDMVELLTVGVEMVVDEQPLAAHPLHSHAKFINPFHVVEVQTANQVCHLQRRVRSRLLTVETHNLIRILHPMQEVGKVVRNDDRHLLSLPPQVLIQSQRRANRIAIG